MQTELPDDLAKIRVWCTDAIQAIWVLHRARDSKAVMAARKRLLDLVSEPPVFSDAVERELILASNHVLRDISAHEGWAVAKHAADVVRQACLRALHIVHAACMKAIKNQVDLWKSSPPKQRDPDYPRWVRALKSLRVVLDDPRQLAEPRHRKVVDRAYRQFTLPLRALPWLPAGCPPLPMDVPRPGGELASFVEKALHRVWSDRLKQRAGDARETDTTRSDVDLEARKKPRRGRPPKGDHKRDDTIYDAWQTGRYKDRRECATTFDLSFKDFVRLLNNVPKRRKKAKEKALGTGPVKSK